MGLDMYLTKDIYIGAEFEHRNVKGCVYITQGEENKLVKIDLSKISSIRERVGYWRKANQIHNWFVKNVQDDEDDCEEYEVSLEQLLQLRGDCKFVLENKDKAEEVLPTAEGFLFGGTGYGEYYFEKLKDTIKIIDEIEKNHDEKDWATYIYRASW